MNLYSAGASSSGWPLIENPSWKMVWNFAIGRPYEIFNSGGSGGTPPAFSWTQVQFYIGLGLLPQVAALASTNSPRPNAFVGLRYDTDPGTSYTVTACTTSSGGTSTYTGTFGGGTNAFVNQTFVITGFSNLVNNGTFVCTGSTASTLVLKNASASVQSGATAFAASNALSDTQFVFEAVNNYNFSVQRNSAPGNTSPTGISVVEGRNYRFEMTCTVAGQVTMLLTDGTTSYSATLTVPTISFPAPPGTAANQTLPGYIHNGVGIISNDTPIPPFVGGSIINSSGWSSALASFNKTALQLISPGTNGCICFLNANSGTGPTSQSATVTGYSALLPWVGFGNDSQSSPTASSKAIMIDAFEFEWNPGINSSNALTPNSLKPRYW